MKKYFSFVVALVLGVAMVSSCSDDENGGLAVVNFEGEYFADLIDDPQYNGPKIYSTDEYKWQDKATTLSSECIAEDWSIWGPQYAGMFGWANGIAISNYVDNDPEASYLKQLSVPVSNGSQQFAVVWDNGSALTFADGKDHIVSGMQIINTTYALNNIKKNYGDGYEFYVTATGKKADGTETGKVKITLAKDSEAIEDWTLVALSTLGAVNSISFVFDGTDKNSRGGLNTPKYFAFDNVVIVK